MKKHVQNNLDFAVPMLKSVHKGTESLNFFGPKIWELLRGFVTIQG